MASDSTGTETIELKKLTCPICTDKFKAPKILQCGHTFCQECLLKVFQNTSNPRCPVCNSKVAKQSQSAEALPTNFAMKALVEDIRPFDRESISRSFGECPTHSEACDLYCRTCERQLCKQCVSDNHGAPDHDTSPVRAVVLQQTEIMKNIASELRESAQKLKGIEEKITASEKTCETEAEHLSEEISSSVAQSSQNISDHAESLLNAVQENKKALYKSRENIRLEHSELFLLATSAIDLCQSLQMDFDKNNLSRVSAIKRLNYQNRKIRKGLARLEENENVLNSVLRFQSLAQQPTVGKFIRSLSLIPVAKFMRKFTTGRYDEDASPLRGFVWPFPYWMITVTQKRSGNHNFVEFYSINFFIEQPYTDEIGIEDHWFYVSNSDYNGEYILSFAKEKVQKFILPSTQNVKTSGKIVSTVFLPTSVNAISWDEKQQGCYALSQDRKTLLHLEFGGPNSCREVAVLEEEITTVRGTHVLHVNREGNMVICDNEEKAVHFFPKIGTEPTVSVKAPADLRNATPECVNSRKGDTNWYILWKLIKDDRCHYCLAVYDPSFKLLGCIENLEIPSTYYKNEKAMFSFQEEYLAVIAGREVAVHVLH